MIDKLTPVSLETSKSVRSVGPTEMLDALNVTITGDEDGSVGIIQNIKGTQSRSMIEAVSAPLGMPAGENVVIGSTEDETLGVVYFYVWNSLGSHGVYAYSVNTKKYRLVFADSSLNFSRNGFVKGDIIRVSRRAEAVSVDLVPDLGEDFEDGEIVGCTDPAATNYNSEAEIDDGSCTYLVPGCTNSLAVNYNPLAEIDDGSCYFEEVIPGCTDPLATNYLSYANSDDGSCEYEPVLPNYTNNLCDYPSIIDPDGNITVQSIEAGWAATNTLLAAGDITEIQAANAFPDYNGDNVWNYLDLSALLIDIIATDSLPISCTIDGGDTMAFTGNLCDYPLLINELGEITISSIQEAFLNLAAGEPDFEGGSLVTFDFPDVNGDGLITFEDMIAATNLLQDQIEDLNTAQLALLYADAGGFDALGMNSAEYFLYLIQNNLMTAATAVSCELPGVGILGCTNPTANNYNPEATLDDGSCAYGGGDGLLVTFEVTSEVDGAARMSPNNDNEDASFEILRSDKAVIFQASNPGVMNPEEFLPNTPYEVASSSPYPSLSSFLFSVPSLFAEGVGPAIGYDDPAVNGISDEHFSDIIATATVVTPETSPTGEPWIPQFYSLGGVHYFIVQTGIVSADPGDDDGSGGGPDGDSGGGGFGPAGELPPRPINLSGLMGVPVMPSKDKKQSDTEKDDGQIPGPGGGSTTDDSSKKKDAVKAKYKTKE